MKISVIHAGGTIGMVRGADGFEPAPGIVEDAVARFSPDLPGAPSVDVTRLDPLIDSANATPADWNRMVGTVRDLHDASDALVITHGTDTMAFSAAALALALEGLARPVILTGAMLPLTEPASDGARNLPEALALAVSGEVPPGVWLRFAGRLLHGARVWKTHSHAFDAFSAGPGAMPPRRAGASLVAHTFRDHETAVIPVAPGMSMGVLAAAMERCDGVVLRCYGSGTVPNAPGLTDALTTARTRRIPVIAVSQCPEGGIALGTYAAGAVLARHGVIDGHDMTVEAAYAKLRLALATTADPDTRRAFLETPLAGEITPPDA